MSNEYTFVMQKPDIILNTSAQREMNRYFSFAKLRIVEMFHVQLCDDSVARLWKTETADPVHRKLLVEYLTNTCLPVVLLNGTNAIKHGVKLKRHIRELYATSHYANCIHTPVTQQEFDNDFAILQGRSNSVKIATIYGVDQNRFRRYSDLSDADFSLCKNNLRKMLHQDNMLAEYVRVLQLEQYGWMVVLNRGSINPISYDVACIFCHYEQFSIEQSYFAFMSADWLGEYPLLISERLDTALKDFKFLKSCNLNVSIRSVPSAQRYYSETQGIVNKYGALIKLDNEKFSHPTIA